MNNFNKVFLSIKKQCGKQKNLAEINNFDAIAKEAGVPADKLPLYLNHLQDIGLIKYSLADKFIYLTAFGKKLEKITAE